MSDELNVHGNVSKKSGFVSNLTDSDRKYIVENIEKIVFETNLIDALNNPSIYEDRGFWNAIIDKLKEKVEKVDGKGLSTNDYTEEDKGALYNAKRQIEAINNVLLSLVSEEAVDKKLEFKVDKTVHDADIIKLTNAISHSVDNEPIPGSDKPISSDYIYTLRQTYDMNFADFFYNIKAIEGIAKGRATGYVFNTVDDLDVWLSDSANKGKLVLGDNFYIKALDVPDYWWDGEQKQQLETQKVNLPEITDALNKKQDKTIILTIGSDGTIGLNNNHECRITTIANELNIILVADDDTPEDYQSYITFKTGDSPQINAIAETQLDYLIRFVGDDCNAEYEFTPSSNTSYEIGFKYVGNSVIEVNAGTPVYKHVFVARVGAF